MSISPWPASQALTVTQGSGDITLIPSSTEFKMAQVIKFPIKRRESVQGRGIEQAHWLKPNESPQCTAAVAAALTVTGTHYLSLISSSFDYCLHQPSSLAAGAHTQHPSASMIESQSIMTPPHESGNLTWQDTECISILKSPDSSVDQDTKYKVYCRSHCANFVLVFNNHIHRFLTLK